MKKVLALGISLALAAAATAAPKETNGHWVHEYPAKSEGATHGARPGSNQITYQGGEVLYAAKVVPIYWGAYWGSGTGATERATMNSFYEQYGTNSHYGVITQYYDTVTGEHALHRPFDPPERGKRLLRLVRPSDERHRRDRPE